MKPQQSRSVIIIVMYGGAAVAVIGEGNVGCRDREERLWGLEVTKDE